MLQPEGIRKNRIQIHCPEEIQCWCSILNCSEPELVYAVKQVGNIVWIVEHFLRNKILLPHYPSQFEKP